jgi:hypothetical protein
MRTAQAFSTGKRRIGARLTLRLFESLGIPVHELLRAEVVPDKPPRGRPPKPKPEDGPAHA